MKIKTEYIHHSSYTLEIENYFLVFDYFEGDLTIPKDKDVYFFVSHFHADHFSKIIFNYQENTKKYIISDDVKKKDIKVSDDKVVLVGANQEICIDGIGIKTYKSTDSGVAFMLNIKGKNIFYAGDLNDWYWEMEDDLQAKNDMHAKFTKQIDKMKDIKIDIAYFLVDPRQAGQYDLGARQILELKPRYFLPMHFWGDFGITSKFKKEYSEKYKDTTIFDMQNKNQKFEIEI